jgi:hypothetical protein
MQMLALDGPARTWEPKRLRLRIFTGAGRLVRGGRSLRLRLAASWPWTAQITTAIPAQPLRDDYDDLRQRHAALIRSTRKETSPAAR